MPLGDHESLKVPVTVPVSPANLAITRRSTRHRVDLGAVALAQFPQARHPDRPAPPAMPLDDHEPLIATVPVSVEPPGPATPRRSTRHRPDKSLPPLVPRTQARHGHRPP